MVADNCTDRTVQVALTHEDALLVQASPQQIALRRTDQPADALTARLLAAQTSGSLAQRVREVVRANQTHAA